MPFAKWTVEPVFISRKPIPPDKKRINELECTSNNALVGVIRQLACLVKISDQIFGELFDETRSVHERTCKVKSKVSRCALIVSKLNAKAVKVPVGDLDAYLQIDYHFKSNQHEPLNHYGVSNRVQFLLRGDSSQSDENNIFTPKSRPKCIRDAYSAAANTPVHLIRAIDAWRDDGQIGSRLFMCQPVFGDARKRVNFDIETRRPASLVCARELPRELFISRVNRSHSERYNVVLNGNTDRSMKDKEKVGDAKIRRLNRNKNKGNGRGNNKQLNINNRNDIKLKRSSDHDCDYNNGNHVEVEEQCPLLSMQQQYDNANNKFDPNFDSDDFDRESPIIGLPTPEEQMQAISQKFPGSFVPIDVSGVGFERMSSLRTSLIHSDFLIRRRRSPSKNKRPRRRNTTICQSANELDNIDDGSDGTLTRRRGRLRRRSVGSIEFVDTSCQTEDANTVLESNTNASLRSKKSFVKLIEQQRNCDGRGINSIRNSINNNLNSETASSSSGTSNNKIKLTADVHQHQYETTRCLGNLIDNQSNNDRNVTSRSNQDGNNEETSCKQFQTIMKSSVKMRESNAMKRVVDDGRSSSGNWSASSSTHASVDSDQLLVNGFGIHNHVRQKKSHNEKNVENGHRMSDSSLGQDSVNSSNTTPTPTLDEMAGMSDINMNGYLSDTSALSHQQQVTMKRKEKQHIQYQGSIKRLSGLKKQKEGTPCSSPSSLIENVLRRTTIRGGGEKPDIEIGDKSDNLTQSIQYANRDSESWLQYMDHDSSNNSDTNAVTPTNTTPTNMTAQTSPATSVIQTEESENDGQSDNTKTNCITQNNIDSNNSNRSNTTANTSRRSSVSSKSQQNAITPNGGDEAEAASAEEAESVYSCDADGYYTSMHTDSGLFRVPVKLMITPNNSFRLKGKRDSIASTATVGDLSINSILSKSETESSTTTLTGTSRGSSRARLPPPPPPPRVSSMLKTIRRDSQALAASNNQGNSIRSARNSIRNSNRSSVLSNISANSVASNTSQARSYTSSQSRSSASHSPSPAGSNCGSQTTASESDTLRRLKLKTNIDSSRHYPSMCAGVTSTEGSECSKSDRDSSSTDGDRSSRDPSSRATPTMRLIKSSYKHFRIKDIFGLRSSSRNGDSSGRSTPCNLLNSTSNTTLPHIASIRRSQSPFRFNMYSGNNNEQSSTSSSSGMRKFALSGRLQSPNSEQPGRIQSPIRNIFDASNSPSNLSSSIFKSIDSNNEIPQFVNVSVREKAVSSFTSGLDVDAEPEQDEEVEQIINRSLKLEERVMNNQKEKAIERKMILQPNNHGDSNNNSCDKMDHETDRNHNEVNHKKDNAVTTTSKTKDVNALLKSIISDDSLERREETTTPTIKLASIPPTKRSQPDRTKTPTNISTTSSTSTPTQITQTTRASADQVPFTMLFPISRQVSPPEKAKHPHVHPNSNLNAHNHAHSNNNQFNLNRASIASTASSTSTSSNPFAKSSQSQLIPNFNHYSKSTCNSVVGPGISYSNNTYASNISPTTTLTSTPTFNPISRPNSLPVTSISSHGINSFSSASNSYPTPNSNSNYNHSPSCSISNSTSTTDSNLTSPSSMITSPTTSNSITSPLSPSSRQPRCVTPNANYSRSVARVTLDANGQVIYTSNSLGRRRDGHPMNYTQQMSQQMAQKNQDRKSSPVKSDYQSNSNYATLPMANKPKVSSPLSTDNQPGALLRLNSGGYIECANSNSNSNNITQTVEANKIKQMQMQSQSNVQTFKSASSASGSIANATQPVVHGMANVMNGKIKEDAVATSINTTQEQKESNGQSGPGGTFFKITYVVREKADGKENDNEKTELEKKMNNSNNKTLIESDLNGGLNPNSVSTPNSSSTPLSPNNLSARERFFQDQSSGINSNNSSALNSPTSPIRNGVNGKPRLSTNDLMILIHNSKKKHNIKSDPEIIIPNSPAPSLRSNSSHSNSNPNSNSNSPGSANGINGTINKAIPGLSMTNNNNETNHHFNYHPTHFPTSPSTKSCPPTPIRGYNSVLTPTSPTAPNFQSSFPSVHPDRRSWSAGVGIELPPTPSSQSFSHSPLNLPGTRRSLASDRLGPTKPTTMNDFKRLLLQSRSSSTFSDRPSASELLRSNSRRPITPIINSNGIVNHAGMNGVDNGLPRSATPNQSSSYNNNNVSSIQKTSTHQNNNQNQNQQQPPLQFVNGICSSNTLNLVKPRIIGGRSGGMLRKKQDRMSYETIVEEDNHSNREMNNNNNNNGYNDNSNGNGNVNVNMNGTSTNVPNGMNGTKNATEIQQQNRRVLEGKNHGNSVSTPQLNSIRHKVVLKRAPSPSPSLVNNFNPNVSTNSNSKSTWV